MEVTAEEGGGSVESGDDEADGESCAAVEDATVEAGGVLEVGVDVEATDCTTVGGVDKATGALDEAGCPRSLGVKEGASGEDMEIETGEGGVGVEIDEDDVDADDDGCARGVEVVDSDESADVDDGDELAV